jgi:hypothetical protein
LAGGAFDAAGTGFLAAEPAVFGADDAGALGVAGFLTGCLAGVDPAGLGAVLEGGGFDGGPLFGSSLSTILIFCTPSIDYDQYVAFRAGFDEELVIVCANDNDG